MEANIDILGIGNAIVDVLTDADDAFLQKHGLEKGGMQLIDADEATALYDAMGPGVEASGGSAANTIAGVASLGGKGAFIGKVRDDQLGEIFAHDIRSLGVHFETAAATDGPPSARCLILVTPDAQRTMNTFLGACTTLGPDDVPEELVKSAKVTYLEGYLWDPPEAKAAFRRAMQIARAHDRQVALTLSDAFCVDRYRDEFQNLAEEHVDLLFANEAEIMSLYQTEDFDEAIARIKGKARCAAVTRSEKGSVVISGGEVHEVPAEKVSKLVDTTGAGDQFAAGFLYGLTHGRDLPTCARIGGVTAAEVISHYGARPEVTLADLVREKGL